MDNQTTTILMSLWKAVTLTMLAFWLLVLFLDPAGYIFFVLASIITGLMAGWMASRKGREGLWPVLYGATWGIIAFIYYAVSPKMEIKEELKIEK